MTNIKTVFDYVNSEVRLRRSCLMIILMTRSITKLEERAQKYLEAIDVIKKYLDASCYCSSCGNWFVDEEVTICDICLDMYCPNCNSDMSDYPCECYDRPWTCCKPCQYLRSYYGCLGCREWCHVPLIEMLPNGISDETRTSVAILVLRDLVNFTKYLEGTLKFYKLVCDNAYSFKPYYLDECVECLIWTKNIKKCLCDLLRCKPCCKQLEGDGKIVKGRKCKGCRRTIRICSSEKCQYMRDSDCCC